MAVKIREPLTATVLAIILGVFGIDRFYVRDYIQGTCKLTMCVIGVILILAGIAVFNSGCLIVCYIAMVALLVWIIADAFCISYRARVLNYEDLCQAMFTHQN